MPFRASSRNTPNTHHRSSDKLSRIPIKVNNTTELLRKPKWIRIKSVDNTKVNSIKKILREKQLHSVCEEAACPNLSECFQQGTATFMIMGDLCTRRCPFCDVAHGRPLPLDTNEPKRLAETIEALQLKYVVITSVDRDDLKDSGAGHFAECIAAIREKVPNVKIEILVPDFRGRINIALEKLAAHPCDVFNHNLETVPRLYKQARPGANYEGSLQLLKQYHQQHPNIITKSGIMLGLGEEIHEIQKVIADLLDHGTTMLTLGQYLQPSIDHLAVQRYYTPEEFNKLGKWAYELGFAQVASGPLVRSSYHADLQVKELITNMRQ